MQIDEIYFIKQKMELLLKQSEKLFFTRKTPFFNGVSIFIIVIFMWYDYGNTRNHFRGKVVW
ncbi:hypothetical protein TU69_25000 [Bacillus cereus]|nr:hypothetical protein TU69_25000 [Bacillus cereus]NHA32761.1 hypothetical protein [Bacillus paranthracis]NHA32835.1 hypothetical protein [Bacillus paranthracis]